MKTDTILLPIKKEYSDLILSRTKTVEVRRGNIPKHIKKVVIYETYPTKKIVGYFDVLYINVLKKDSHMYNYFEHEMQLNRVDFDKYLEGKDFAQLIHINDAYRFKNHLSLKGKVPQAFKYITDSELELIIKEGRNK